MLNFSSGFQHFPNDLELSFNLPYVFTRKNNSILSPSAIQHVHTRKTNIIWKAEVGDRIYAQLNFKPKFNTSLPPKRIMVEDGTAGWNIQPGNHVFMQEECNIKHCEIVDNPPQGGGIDARMFKEIELGSHRIQALSKTVPRHSEQIWIMFALESPMASPDYSGVDHVINWTATYRPDSTIVTPYDKWLPFENSRVESMTPARNFAKGKTKFAAIFMSNCDSTNGRLDYVHELQKHLTVDVFGACGDRQCERHNQESCFEMLRKEYKFYLAFENANCRHYISEKLFLNALRHDVLPVVMGAHPVDYARAAPPGSYIHVEDFDSVKQLADHLKKLDKDDNLYNQYFRWQSCGRFINTKFWCRICSMLWDPDRPRLSVASLEEWWRRNNTCINNRKWKDAGPIE